MTRTLTASIALILAAAGLWAAPARADALQDRVLADARAARETDFAFTRTTTIEQLGSARRTLVERYDPRRPLADRWALLSIDGRAPTPKEIAGSRKNAPKRRVPHYGEIAKWFGSPATRVASGPGTATYRFARLPAGVLKIGPHDASPHTGAEAVVNTAGRAPYVESVRLLSAKPFRMALVASVRRMAFTNRYRPAAGGRPVPVGGDADISGSLLGKSGELRTRIGYSDYLPLR